MKIAIFSDTFPPQIDGVANVAYRSARELSKLGHDVNVLTLSNKFRRKHNDESIFAGDDFNLIRVPSVPAFTYSGNRFALPMGISYNILRKNKPDIIHTHTPFSMGWSSILVAKILKIPIIGTHHTFFNHYLKYIKMDNPVGEKISWKYTVGYYNFCDMVLSPSKSLANELQHFGLKKPIKILSNPIDTNLFKPVSSTALKKKLKKSYGICGASLIYMGRLSYEKSVAEVVKAANIVIKKNPSTKLVIVGDGPERKNLEELVKNLGIENSVIFTGFLHDKKLVEILEVCDIFLTASKTENMPLSVLEAMACGLPIIAANALGIPEIVKDKVNGFLTTPDDSKDMAKKSLKLLSDENLLNKFSTASREMSLVYSQENVAKSLEKTYKELIVQTNENLSLSRIL